MIKTIFSFILKTPLLLILLAIIIIKKIFFKSSNMQTFIDHVQKWEGGKSKATTDTASKNPCPDTGGIHTNKGVTWTTFKSLSNKLGYKPTKELFLSMPDNIWLSIFKHGYWNIYKLDELYKTKPNISYFIAQFAWGFGGGGSESRLANYQRKHMGIKDTNITKIEIMQNFKNDIVPEKIRLASLIEYKKEVFKSLNQPANLKGWLNRLADFKKTFNS